MALPRCRIHQALLLALLVLYELRAETTQATEGCITKTSPSGITYCRKNCADGQKRKAGKSNLLVTASTKPNQTKKKECIHESSHSPEEICVAEIGKVATTLSSISKEVQSFGRVTQEAETSSYATTSTAKDDTWTTSVDNTTAVQTKSNVASDSNSSPSTMTFPIETKTFTTLSSVSEKTQPYTTSITQREEEPSTYVEASTAKEETGERTTPLYGTATVQIYAPTGKNETSSQNQNMVILGSSIFIIVLIVASIGIAIFICRKKRNLESRRQEQGSGTEMENFMSSP